MDLLEPEDCPEHSLLVKHGRRVQGVRDAPHRQGLRRLLQPRTGLLLGVLRVARPLQPRVDRLASLVVHVWNLRLPEFRSQVPQTALTY